MKQILQIKGLQMNLFLVKIFTSYSGVTGMVSNNKLTGKGALTPYLNELSLVSTLNSRVGDKGNKVNTLKRISQLQIIIYMIFNIQKIIGSNKIEKNISVKDGKITITQGKKIKQTFIYKISGIIIQNQENYNIEKEKGEKKEKYIILLTNKLGITIQIQSNDWIQTIISWELFNMSQYQQVSLKSESESGKAASLKYFVLSALSTAFLLLGVCMQYYLTGSTHYEVIETSLRELNAISPIMGDGSVKEGSRWVKEKAKAQILKTFLFKQSAAPFYQWAPDLYENIETKITKWMIIIPKLTVLSFIYLFTQSNSFFIGPHIIGSTLFTTSGESVTGFILLFTGAQSQIIGSIALNYQWYIKRFFAYSGISHIGFKLLALYSLESQGYIFYILIYGITTVNIFTILIKLSQFKGRDLKNISDLSGMFKYSPLQSFAFALNLFSLAGDSLLKNLRVTSKLLRGRQAVRKELLMSKYPQRLSVDR